MGFAEDNTYDTTLLFPVLFLVGIGIVMVYSASSAIAHNTIENSYFFLKKQALFALAGTVVMLLCRRIPYRLYRSLTYPALLAAVVLLAAIHLTGFGYSAGGSARWLRFGSVNFQPSEFARLALIFYLAYSLDKKQGRLQRFAIGFVPHAVVLGVLTGLILAQPDFGSVVILGALTWIMLFVGGVRFRHLLGTMLLILPALGYHMIHAEYRLKRLLSFLDPWKYATDEGYQIIHSWMAFGTGGLWGTGIGQGYQKLFYLPEPHTDFIFSVVGEELGLAGVTVTLILYGLILWRGVIVARRAPDTYGTLLAFGLTAGITLQVCVNMGVSLGLLPTKGLTLPFLSYGGTSLLVNMASVGILMNIAGAKPAAAVRERTRAKR
ncbi:MAG TPA: putative lipid II flippase FtsW [Desulfobacterales bacterium]